MLKQTVTLALILGLLTMAPAHGGDHGDEGLNEDACTFNGFPLYGDIQIVESFPDIKVQIVESFADLHVQTVTSFPDDCGLWKFVTSFPDVKIQYVTSFPDIKVKMVTSFPGLQ